MRQLFTLCLLTILCTCVSALFSQSVLAPPQSVVSAQNDELRLTESVYFASAGHEPDAAELAKLAAFATTLGSYAGYTLKIEAFTDEQGTDAYNNALAERRATAITSALARQNVVPATSEVLSYGEQRARQNTTDDAERRNDRRVDLVATVTRWESADDAIKQARAEQLQTITIEDPSKRQAISGAKGGAFLLEANSLVRADGTPAVGPVSVELVEAYDLSDMLIAGLTTTAAGKRLVTGGMISLTAMDADGEPLALRAGSSVKAATPTDDFNEQMRIFSGANHDQNGAPTDWALTTGGVASSADALFASLPPLPTLAFYQLKANEKARREKYLAARAERARMLGDKLSALDDLTGQQSNISRYFFSVNQLGWTNVDIYPNEQGNVQLFARVENSSRDATVVLIPTDRRSVIAYQPGPEEGVWQRRGIPRGVGYHVIAYQVIDGKLVMAHRFVDKANEAPAQLTYEPIAIADLKDRIAGILGS